MTEKLNIVQSTTEPDKRNIWLKDNELKKFGAKGWSTIGGSNSSDNNNDNKIYVYADTFQHKILINGVEYEASFFTDRDYFFYIKNETLYNYINNCFNKNYYVYVTIIMDMNDSKGSFKGLYPLVHIEMENDDFFDINIYFDYYSLCRIAK